MSAQVQTLRELLAGTHPSVSALLDRIDGRGLEPGLLLALMEWGAHLRVVRGFSHNTVHNYLDAVSRFFAWLTVRGSGLAAVSTPLAEEYQRHLYVEIGLGAKARDVHITAIRRFFAWREAMGAGISPVRSVPGPRQERRVPKKYNAAQLQRLFGACDRGTALGRRDYAILLFFYGTGARRHEVVALSLDSLEFRERFGYVTFHGKGAKERVVRFERPVMDGLHAWFADRDRLQLDDPAAVFVGVKGRWVGRRLDRSGMSHVLGRATRQADLRGNVQSHLHRLRVTFATDLYDAGVDIERIRIALGHEKIETTRGYIAVSDRQLQTSMPVERLLEVTGEKRDGMPLWFRRKTGQLQD
ncbi:tyrosine-type recombinase/integrase [Thioalbus denitrificans]|uniref:Site-specific recombinase XerD n=1 Tax=Thioalbus denitrificans TaxID=547122 RepID=A0A369CDF1_9GAMM|nr:tyrosine-type recombinase/integrase [Thioalbus denitrificans]RCX32062.1 site-specific recombinase XerD [Thioalbus denitrificans]